MGDQVLGAQAVGLLVRVADSDPAAFAELLVAHAPSVRRRLASRGLNQCAADLDEATQEVFLRVWRQRHQYLPCGSGEGYLGAIADHVAGEWLRGKRRWERPQAESTMLPPRDPGTLGPTTVERLAMGHEASQRLQAALAELPEKQRTAVRLCWLEHMPSSAAARHLHCSPNALKKRLRQAKQLLRERLESFPLWAS